MISVLFPDHTISTDADVPLKLILHLFEVIFSEQDTSSVFFEWGEGIWGHVFCIIFVGHAGKTDVSESGKRWKHLWIPWRITLWFFPQVSASNRWSVFLVSGFRMDIYPCLPKMKHSKFQNINFQFNNHQKAKSFPIRKKVSDFFVIENLLQMVVEFMYPQTI